MVAATSTWMGMSGNCRIVVKYVTVAVILVCGLLLYTGQNPGEMKIGPGGYDEDSTYKVSISPPKNNKKNKTTTTQQQQQNTPNKRNKSKNMI